MRGTELTDPVKLTAKSALGKDKKQPYLCHRTSKRFRNWQHPGFFGKRGEGRANKWIID